MTYRYVITTDRELDIDNITVDLGERDRHFDIRPDDDGGTIRCAEEAHDTFERLVAEIEGYCVRIVTESGGEFDAVLIRAPGLVRRVDNDCNPIADKDEVSIASIFVY